MSSSQEGDIDDGPDGLEAGSVTVERHGAVELIVLDHPKRMNALTATIMRALDEVMLRFDADPDAHVAVITGAGTEAFSAGADLEALLPELHARGLEAVLSDPAERFFSRVTKPIVAAVEGFCLAGGLEVLLGTDLRVAGQSASFGLAEVRWGLIPAGGSHVRLPRQIPWAIAMELLLTGEAISAQRAYEAGLINEVVVDGTALERAMAIATRISRNGPLAVTTAKQIAVASLALEEGFRCEAAFADRVFRSEDAREGPRAFLERRRPQFTGR